MTPEPLLNREQQWLDEAIGVNSFSLEFFAFMPSPQQKTPIEKQRRRYKALVRHTAASSFPCLQSLPAGVLGDVDQAVRSRQA